MTEGKIARLRSALRLTGRADAALAPGRGGAARRDPRAARGDQNDGWVQKVRTACAAMPATRWRCSRRMSAAGPLIASLDERQRASGRSALRAMGGASMF